MSQTYSMQHNGNSITPAHDAIQPELRDNLQQRRVIYTCIVN